MPELNSYIALSRLLQVTLMLCTNIYNTCIFKRCQVIVLIEISISLKELKNVNRNSSK